MITGTNFRLMVLTWGYCIIKFLAGYRLMSLYGVNPWIFFGIDMTSVPLFILGWEFLLKSTVAKEARGNKEMFFWGGVTFLSSTSPYLYAALAGKKSFPPEGWAILGVITFFPIINICKNIYNAVKTKQKQLKKG